MVRKNRQIVYKQYRYNKKNKKHIKEIEKNSENESSSSVLDINPDSSNELKLKKKETFIQNKEVEYLDHNKDKFKQKSNEKEENKTVTKDNNYLVPLDNKSTKSEKSIFGYQCRSFPAPEGRPYRNQGFPTNPCFWSGDEPLLFPYRAKHPFLRWVR